MLPSPSLPPSAPPSASEHAPSYGLGDSSMAPRSKRYVVKENSPWTGFAARAEPQNEGVHAEPCRGASDVPGVAQAHRPAPPRPESVQPDPYEGPRIEVVTASGVPRGMNALQLPPPRPAVQTTGAGPFREPHNAFSQLWQSVSQMLHGPASAARFASVSYNGTDHKVQKRFQDAKNADQLHTFQDAWQRLNTSPKDPKAKKVLAQMYAQAMGASRLLESDKQKFHDCIEIGQRALELHGSCGAALEQLGIAYSIVQAPLSEAKRYVDQAVRVGRIAQLAPSRRAVGHAHDFGSFRPSADFYFVYWRLFRGDPTRTQQVAWALDRYNESPPSQRSFDGKLNELLLLERQAAVYTMT